MKNKVVVLGNDHANSLGVVQALGLEGFYVTAFVWGVKTGFLKWSRYVKEFYSAKDAQSCIDMMLNVFSGEKNIPIIPCCDTAALVISKNADRLKDSFLFEYVSGKYSVEELQQKSLQVQIAEESGFDVPQSVEVNSIEDIESLVDFKAPYLIKPLVSIQGAKSDIVVCSSHEELINNVKNVLKHTTRVLVQQCIDKDFDLCIIGCSTKEGRCIIPVVENKLSLYPPITGSLSKAMLMELKDEILISSVKKYISRIRYVGLFSVELMHCKIDGKYYFTEINLRNDGGQSFIRKFGVNFPVIHVNDMLGSPIVLKQKFRPGIYLYETHHYQSWRAHHITFSQWLKELLFAKGLLFTCYHDNKPFFKQWEEIVRRIFRMRIKEKEYYQ